MESTAETSSEADARPISKPTTSRRRRVLALYSFLTLGLIFGGYSCGSYAMLNREIRSADRDPETGVIRGAESANFGDPSSEQACLLLHGLVGSPIDFADLGERLAEAGFYVRVPLLPGHGTTPKDFARQTPESMIQGALDEYRALRERYEKVNVIGFSMGGTIATILASTEDIHRLALVAPYYRVTYRFYYILPAEAWNAMLWPVIRYVPKGKGFVRVNRREAVDQIFSYRNIPTRGARTLMKLGKQARSDETLKNIHCPVLVLHSHGDEAASPSAAVRAFQAIGSPEKQIHWYTKRSNHHLFWDYDAEDVKRRIIEFLSKPPDPAPRAIAEPSSAAPEAQTRSSR